MIYLKARTPFACSATLQQNQKRIQYTSQCLPLCLLIFSLVSALRDMAFKCHLETLLEITDGKLHSLLRQNQCYVDEGQFLQHTDSSVSIGAASARNHVLPYSQNC